MARFLVAFLMSVMISAAFPVAGYAQSGGGGGGGGELPQSACDPAVMRAMNRRAEVAVQQDLMQTRAQIFRPDSVFKYTCFDKSLNHIVESHDGKQPFSEKGIGEPVEGIDPATELDTAVDGAVGTAFRNYMEANFEYGYLNERAGEDYTHDSQVQGGEYECGEMAKIWEIAKGMNYRNLPTDGPQSPTYLFGCVDGSCPAVDPRNYPMSDSMETDPQLVEEMQRSMAIAAGDDPDNPTALTAASYPNLPKEGPRPERDNVQTYHELTMPTSQTKSGKCADPRPTGEKTSNPEINDGEPYDVMQCTNPDCVFVVDGSGGGECKKSTEAQGI